MDTSEIKKLVSENNIIQALNELQSFLFEAKKYQYLEGKTISIIGKYKEIKEQDVKGIISEENKSIKYNIIRDDILKILKEIENPDKFQWIISNFFENQSTHVILMPITILLLAIGGGIFYKYNNNPNLTLLDSRFDIQDSPYAISNDTISLNPEVFYSISKSLEAQDSSYVILNDTISFNSEAYYSKSKLAQSEKEFYLVKTGGDSLTNYRKLDHQLLIDKLNEGYRYSYPTIDFKFLNKGGSTAVITEFKIDVLELRLNPKPELEFQWDVVDGNLYITAKNYGWGSAVECECELINSTFDDLYLLENLKFKGEIDDSDEKLLFRLATKKKLLFNTYIPGAQQTALNKLSQSFVKVEGYKKIMTKGLKVTDDYNSNINIFCAYSDIDKVNYKDTFEVHSPYGYNLYITSDRFIKIHYENNNPNNIAPSKITYVSFIDKKEDLIYPTLHEIKAGDTERFHIMIAAYKSCYAEIKLQFKTNNNEIIESNPLSFNIWSPKWKLKNDWDKYIDGKTISREIQSINENETIKKIKSFPEKVEDNKE